MKENLLDDNKVENVDAQDKGCEEASGENSIPGNQGLNVSNKKGGKSKNNDARLGKNKNESKDKKKVKEKVREKPDQKYEPHHRRKRKQEGCMTWMSIVNWVPSIDKGPAKDSNLKEAPS